MSLRVASTAFVSSDSQLSDLCFEYIFEYFPIRRPTRPKKNDIRRECYEEMLFYKKEAFGSRFSTGNVRRACAVRTLSR